MRVLVTGANGFIGKNLLVHLRERGIEHCTTFVRGDSLESLDEKLATADFVFHLAGINRPQNVSEFAEGNTLLTEKLCQGIVRTGRSIPVVFASSVQAEQQNDYGASKRAAEEALRKFSEVNGIPVWIYRLPNVFGKWCRPNYNSAVATFCNNIVRNLPVTINNVSTELQLVYIDDVVAELISCMDRTGVSDCNPEVSPIYRVTLGELVDMLRAFKESRSSLVTERVGAGFARALYSTYISYYPPEMFAYPLVKHGDPRGVFVEMLKTRDSGQFSFFTAHPGVTRGGHYHHTKTEKFLVIKGEARFCFLHIDTGATYELCTNADVPSVVETIPGWSHDITNVGNEEMIVMLWANEVFDRQHPDTVAYGVSK